MITVDRKRLKLSWISWLAVSVLLIVLSTFLPQLIDTFHPVLLSARLGLSSLLRTSIAFGFNPNAVDGFGRTAVMWAARSGDERTFVCLVENGADIRKASRINETVLMMAVRGRDVNVVKYCLEQGLSPTVSEINGGVPDGTTAFTYAEEQGDSEIIRLLAQYQNSVVSDTISNAIAVNDNRLLLTPVGAGDTV